MLAQLAPKRWQNEPNADSMSIFNSEIMLSPSLASIYNQIIFYTYILWNPLNPTHLYLFIIQADDKQLPKTCFKLLCCYLMLLQMHKLRCCTCMM